MGEIQPPKVLEHLWSPEQLALYMGITRQTVYRWIKHGKVLDPAKIKKIGHHVRIPRSEVERIAGKEKEKLEVV